MTDPEHAQVALQLIERASITGAEAQTCAATQIWLQQIIVAAEAPKPEFVHEQPTPRPRSVKTK